MRGGGRRGGRGRGGRGEGSRRDARPGGAAPRDRRDRRADYSPRRRPDYSPRRRNDYSPRRHSPSPGRRARRPRSEYDDRGVNRGNRGVDYGGDRDRTRGSLLRYGGDRSPHPGRGDSSYDHPGRLHREGYGADSDLPYGQMSYGGERDRPVGRRDLGYDDLHPEPGRRRREGDYGSDGDLLHKGHREDYNRDVNVPRHGRGEDYYRQEHNRGERGASETYNAPSAYMLPDHLSNLSRPSLHSGRKESDYGFPSDRSLNRDSEYAGSPGRRYFGKAKELFGEDGMTLRISATESGRTTALYQERSSPPPRAVLSPPPPLYPSLPPTGNGFLTGRLDMVAGDNFGTGSARLPHDDSRVKYGDHLGDSYVERSRGTERHYSGCRDMVVKEDGGTDRHYPAADMPISGNVEADRLYSTRGMLGSDLGPRTQPKQIGDSSESLLAKDRQYRIHSESDFEQNNGYAMNGLGILPHRSSGHGRVHSHRFSGRSLDHGSDHGDEAILDIARQGHSNLAPRAEPLEYGGHEYVQREPIMDTYVASEDSRGNDSQNPRHMLSSASVAGLRDEGINHHLRLSRRMGEDEESYQGMLHDTVDDLQHSYEARASVRYLPARGSSDRFSHSPGFEPIGTERQPARHHGFASFEDGRDLSDREVSPMISRRRYRSPTSHDHEMDLHQSDDRFAGRGYYDMVEYEPSPRMSRFYDMGYEDDDDDARYVMPSNRNVFSRLGLPDEFSGEWTDAEQESHPHSSTLAYRQSKHKPMLQRLSRTIVHSKFEAPSMLGRGRGGMSKSGKKRMRIAHHNFDGGYTSPRNEFIRPNKYPKSLEKDNPTEAEMDNEDTPESEDLPAQKDPPEDSEEFTKQVHQAFLKYSKILNESPDMQKKFCDAPKGTLSCCVCGSVARKFPDIDALASHAYDTCKVSLKTKHLGFHKALCVLMGWNWHVAPDTSKSHYSIPAEEVNAMRGDLMLWPPVVVIHNSSIAIKTKDIESKIVTKEEIEGLLADIGIALEKTRVSHGKPANQSIFLVQFQPTISGFQDAMKIHENFSAKNHGKEDFQQMRGGKGKQSAPIDNLDELLYAHIAVAEDLGYLDEGTKRRCVIRSKMDIEAKADATLNMEP